VTAPAIAFQKLLKYYRLVCKNNSVRVELFSAKIHSGADYTSLTHADYCFIDQVSWTATVTRIKEKVVCNSEQKIFCLENFQV